MKLEKDHYYLIKEPLLTRIKVVTVVDNYIGYIYANAKRNMESMLIYADITTNPFEVLRDLGKYPDFSDDENKC